MSETRAVYDAIDKAVNAAARGATGALEAEVADLRQRVADLEQRAVDAQRWPEWMTVSDAAAYCGVSVSWLQDRTQAGEVMFWRPTGEAHRRYQRADLDALMRGDARRSAA